MTLLFHSSLWASFIFYACILGFVCLVFYVKKLQFSLLQKKIIVFLYSLDEVNDFNLEDALEPSVHESLNADPGKVSKSRIRCCDIVTFSFMLRCLLIG